MLNHKLCVRPCLRAMLPALLWVLAGPVAAATLDSEDFSSPFRLRGTGHNMTVAGGRLEIAGTNADGNAFYEVAGPGGGVPFTASARIGEGTGANGQFNVGLVVGNNTVLFHPGYAGAALRVEGTGGVGNQNVGFTPAANVLHPLTVTGDGAGNMTLRLEDGQGIASPFSIPFVNATNTANVVGVRRSGPGTLIAIFDDITVNGTPVATFDRPFAATVNGRVEAAGGMLAMQGSGTSAFTLAGQSGDLRISGLVGSNPGSGNTNVGLRIGGNSVVFHPNHGGGAFRVDGGGGFGNTDMGWTPAGGVLHKMEAAVDAATGKVTVALQDANNPNNLFVARYTSTAYTPGSSRIGFHYGSGTGGDEGRYDNLNISAWNRSLDASSTWVQAVQASNPRLWYRLNETGTMFATDYGSAGQHAVYQRACVQGVSGAVDGAVAFDGTNSTIRVGMADIATAWTAEFILARTGQETAGSLLTSSAGALRLDQHNNTGRVGYTRFGVADWQFSPGYSAPLNEFLHMTYLADPLKGITLLINGVPVASNPNFISLPLHEIGGGEAARAVLDEVVIYDRLLSQDEILRHSVGAGFDVPEPASLALLGLALTGMGGYLKRRRTA